MNPKLLVMIPVLAVVLLNWYPGIDEAAHAYLDRSMTDSLVVYGTARALNGLISVIQSVHISFGIGAGIGLNLGEVLDPLNDLVERFSGFVLYGLAAIGLQKLVLMATASLPMKIVATLGIVAGFIAWFRESRKLAWLVRLAVIVALVRFFLVIEVGTVAVLDAVYFDGQKAHANSALDLAKIELGELHQKYIDSAAEGGIVDGIRGITDSVIGSDSQQGIADLAASAVVELIVMMLVRSILMPLLFVWLLLLLIRQVSTASTGQRGFDHQAKALEGKGLP